MATFAAVDRALAARPRLGALVQVSVDRAADLPDGGVRFVADNPVFVAWGDAPAAGPAASAPAVPTVVAVGIGCSPAATAVDGRAAAVEALAAARALGPGGAGEGSPTPAVVATIDRRAATRPWTRPPTPSMRPSPSRAARRTAVVTFPASLLAVVDVPNPSADGRRRRRHAQRGRGRRPAGRRTRAPGWWSSKRRGADRHRRRRRGPEPGPAAGRVRVVGLGPGAPAHRTPAAVRAVRSADAVSATGPTSTPSRALLRPDQLVVRSTMGAEAERAVAGRGPGRGPGWTGGPRVVRRPRRLRHGVRTLELAADAGRRRRGRPRRDRRRRRRGRGRRPPGRAARPRSPCPTCSLPWDRRSRRHLRAAAASGLALALFNPRSAGPPRPPGPGPGRAGRGARPGDTPVVVVTDATGPDRGRSSRTTLADLDPTVVGMRSIVLVGTADTVDAAGRLVTRRHHPRSARQAVTAMIPPVHPIEAESYRILAERVDLDRWPPLQPGGRGPGHPRRGRRLLRRHPRRRRGRLRGRGRRPAGRGARSCRDVEMVAVATRRAGTVSCSPRDARGPSETGRPSPTSPSRPPPCGWPPTGGRRARSSWSATPPPPSPRWSRLAAAGRFRAGPGHRPARRVRRARPTPRPPCGRAGCPPSRNVGERGGSAVAAAALNALWRLQPGDAPGDATASCTWSAPAPATRCCSPGGPPACWPRPTSWWSTAARPTRSPPSPRPAPSGCFVGRTPDGDAWPLRKVVDLLAAHARAGRTVVRLKSGDLFVCSRGAEEVAALVARGVRVEDDARRVGGHRRPARRRGRPAAGHAGDDASGNDDPAAVPVTWEALADPGSTLVVLIGRAHQRTIARRLHGGRGGPPARPPPSSTPPPGPAPRWPHTDLAHLGGTRLPPPATVVIGPLIGGRVHIPDGWIDLPTSAAAGVVAAGGGGRLRPPGAAPRCRRGPPPCPPSSPPTCSWPSCSSCPSGSAPAPTWSAPAWPRCWSGRPSPSCASPSWWCSRRWCWPTAGSPPSG